MENEFNTENDALQSQARNLDACENDSSREFSDEIEEIVRKIEHRDQKYWLDAAGMLEKVNASEIIKGIKKMSKGGREEQGKRKRKREKEGTSTISAKLRNLLDQMPHFMAAANQAGQEHTKALKKWEKKVRSG